MRFYTLDDKNNPVPCSLDEWGKYFKHDFKENKRRVAEDRIGEYYISTIFLGVDHNFFEVGPPLVFETMVFKDDDYGCAIYENHYSTWNEAGFC